MSPETTKIVLTLLKALGLLLLLVLLPLILSMLAGWLEKVLCGGIGSFNASAYSVLASAVIGLVRGVCYSWVRIHSAGLDAITLAFSGPTRRWTAPVGSLSFNVPYDVADLLTYLEAWLKLPLYVVGVIVLARALCDALFFTTIPIALIAVLFSYAAYVYTGFLTVAVIVPIGFFVFLLYILFSAVCTKTVLVDQYGRRYEEVR